MAQLTDDCFAFGGSLLPIAQARALLSQRLVTVAEVETAAVAEALGRILAEDLSAGMNVPPHDNSAVDGFAIRFDDLDPERETTLPIIGRLAAGDAPSGKAARRGAVRIFTGAPMPPGCDTVMMQEDCRIEADRVTFLPGIRRGANRRKAGEDISRGSIVLKAGRRLLPQDLGLAASLGHSSLKVRRRLRIALFSTGNEVHEPGTQLPPGGVYDANRFALGGLLRQLGAAVTDLGILRDDAAEIRRALQKAAARHDLIVTSGGVSAGDEDHVKGAVEALGSLYAWRLAIKPGRPVALGQVGATPFIGLPGNPVAVMVTFLRLARPMILKLSGAEQVEPPSIPVRAEFDYKKKEGRREFVRVRLQRSPDGALSATKFPRDGAGILTSMVESDGLVELAEDVTVVKPGSTVDYIPYSLLS
jgi:molybdopterin molybdotransferase